MMRNLTSRSKNTKIIKIICALVMLLVLLAAAVSYAWFRNTIEVPGVNLQTGTFQYQFIGYHMDNSSSELKVDFAYSTLAQEGNSFDAATGEGYNPILQDGALTAVTDHTNITNDIQHPGEIYYVIRKLDQSVDLDISINLDAELSKLQEFSGSGDSLEAVGGFWYSIVDITGTASSRAVIEQAIKDSNVFTVDGNPKQERTEEYFPNIRNEFLTTTLDDANEYWCFKLSYGVKENADTSAYAGKTINLAVNLCVAQKGGLEGDESSAGQYFVRTLQQLKDALLVYKPNDSIIVQDNITYEGDLIINRPLKLQMVGSELTVKGNMRYNYASQGSFILNTSLSGRLSVLKMDDVDAGGSLYLDIPHSSIELIGQNSTAAGNADIYIENTFSADVGYDTGMIVTRSRICNLDDSLKTIYLRNESTLDVYARTSVGTITVHNDNLTANRPIRIHIVNKGTVEEINLVHMDYVAGAFSNPRIFIDNYGEIAKDGVNTPIKLPTWSYKWFPDVDGKRDASNTRIIHQQGAGFMSVTNANKSGFQSDGSGVESRDNIEYVSKETLVDKDPDAANIIVHYMDNDIFVVRNENGEIESDDTSLKNIIEYYLPDGRAEESYRIAELNEIVSLKVICYGNYELTAEDYAFIRSMSALVTVDLSEAVSAEVDANGRTVPDNAFSGLSNLRYLTMSQFDNAWGSNIFAGTAIDDITLPPALTTLEPDSLTGIKYLHIGNHAQLIIDSIEDYTDMYIFCADENTREALIVDVEAGAYERFKEHLSERPSTAELDKIDRIFLEAERHGDYYVNLYDNTCFIVTYVGDTFDAGKEKNGYYLIDDFNNEVYYEFDFATLRIGNEIYQVAGYDDFAFYGKTLATWGSDTLEFSDTLSSVGDYAFYGVSLPANVDLGGCKTLGHGGLALNESVDIFTALKLESAGYYGFGKMTNVRYINTPNLILHYGRLIADCANIIRFDTGVLELADGDVDHGGLRQNGQSADGYYLTGWTAGPWAHIVHTENANPTPTDVARYHSSSKPRYVLVSGEYASYYRENQGEKGINLIDLDTKTAEDLRFVPDDVQEFGSYVYVEADIDEYELVACIRKTAINGTTDKFSSNGVYTVPAYIDANGEKHNTTRIGENAFRSVSMTHMDTLTFDDSYLTIGHSAFYPTSYYQTPIYTHLDLNNVQFLEGHSFRSARMLTVVGTEVIAAHDYSIMSCTNLVMASLPNLSGHLNAGSNLTWYLFYGCSNLETVSIGALNGGSTIFNGCHKLETVYVNVADAPDNPMSVSLSPDFKGNLIAIGGDFYWEASATNGTSAYDKTVIDCEIEDVIFSEWSDTAYSMPFGSVSKEYIISDPGYIYVKRDAAGKKLDLLHSFINVNISESSYILPDVIYKLDNEEDVTTIFGNKVPKYTYVESDNGTTSDTGMYVVAIGDYIFKESINVQNVTFPRYLEYIGESAFEGCSFGDVVINGTGSLIIEDKAFYGATMESLTLHGAQSIGAQSFAGIKGPTNSAVVNAVPVHLGDVLTNVGESAFEGACIESVTATHNAINNIELNIGANAFYTIKGEAEGEIAVDFGGAYVKLGEYSFGGVKLSSVKIPNMRLISSFAFDKASISGELDLSGNGNGVTPEVQPKAFNGDSSSKKMRIGSVILGEDTVPQGSSDGGAFNYCAIGTFDFNGAPDPNAYILCNCSLSNVYFGEGITALPKNTFSQCGELGNLYFEGVQTIGDYVFGSVSKKIGVIDFGSATYIGSNSFSYSTINGDVTVGDGVVISGSFLGSTISGSITVGDGATVNNNAFNGSTITGDVTFGDNANIKGTAFNSFTVGGNLTLGDNATLTSQSFNNGTVSGNLYLGDGLTLTARNFLRVNIYGELSIGSYTKGSSYSSSSAFGNKEYIRTVNKLVFRESCTSIAASTFAFMKIGELDFGNHVTTIGQDAFAGTSITNIKNMGSVTSIGANAFGTKDSIKPKMGTGMDISNVTSIGDNAFDGNTLNYDLDLSNVSTLGTGVFKNTVLNGSVTLGARTEILESFFEGATLNGILDLSRITSILTGAFKDAKLSQDLVFDNSITIAESAFNGATIPNVTFIGGGTVAEQAFANSHIGVLRLGAIASIAGAVPTVAEDGTVSGDDTGAFCRADIGELYIENAADPAAMSFAYATVGVLDYGNLTQTGLTSGADVNGYSSPFYGVASINRINFNRLQTLGQYYFKDVEIGSIDTAERIVNIRDFAFVNCDIYSDFVFNSLVKLYEKSFSHTNVYGDLKFISGISFGYTGSASKDVIYYTVTYGDLYIDKLSGTWNTNVDVLQNTTVNGTFTINQGILQGGITSSRFNGEVDLSRITGIQSSNGVFDSCTFASKTLDLANMGIVRYYTFEDCTFSEGTVIYLDSATEISRAAFYNARGVIAIIAPNVEVIYSGAFRGCSSLKSINLPSIRQFVYSSSSKESPFEGCSSLEQVLLGENFTSYQSGDNDALFPNSCTLLKQVIILADPDNITFGANMGLPGEAKLFVPISMKAKYDALLAASSPLWGSVTADRIETIERVISDGSIGYLVTDIADGKIEIVDIIDDGTMLLDTTFTFPSTLGEYTVVSIGGLALSRLSGIETVVLPSTLEYINFSGISVPTSVMNYEIAATNPTYKTVDGILYSKDGKTLVLYPAGRSGEITLNSGVEIIGQNAFAGCTLISKVTIAQSVVIADGAFARCVNLSEIVFTSNTASIFIGRGIFDDCHPSLVIKVPSASLDSYKQFVFYDTDIVDRIIAAS